MEGKRVTYFNTKPDFWKYSMHTSPAHYISYKSYCLICRDESVILSAYLSACVI